jgi:hypothetical protein
LTAAPASGISGRSPPSELEPPLASDFKTEIASRVEAAGGSEAYANYLKVLELVFVMMDDWARLDPKGGPSAYWREEIAGFEYMFDPSPLIVGSLRHHCHHITGIKDYEYRQHHAHQQPEYVAKFQLLKSLDPAGLFVPEPEALGGFGFDVGEGLANLDTLKFYEVLLGLQKAGLLARFRGEDAPRRTVLEIGSGWGGFAYQFKRLCPRATFICLDLPPTLLFSAPYLMTLFPEAKTLIYGEPGFEEKVRDIPAYDFVFLPHYYFPRLAGTKIDLGINMVSFQEMTTGQVEAYARTLKELGCRRIYSMNRNRSKHNTQLTTVAEVLGRHYELSPIEVCPLQYVHLAPRKKAREPTDMDYRHYFGHC